MSTEEQIRATGIYVFWHHREALQRINEIANLDHRIRTIMFEGFEMPPAAAKVLERNRLELCN